MATPRPLAPVAFPCGHIPAAISGGIVVAAALTAILPGDGPRGGASAPPDDRDLSAGRWNVAAVEWDGRAVDPEWLARLLVVYRPDGSWAVFLRRIPVAEGTSTNRQDVSPKTFEMRTLGSERIEPRRFRGIYRIEGDTRTLCIVRDGTPMPDGFTAPRGSRRMLVTLTRAPEATGGPRSRPPTPRGREGEKR